MNDDFEEMRKLMALKRFERPPEGFVDDFLAEFHHRQRRELLQKSSVSLLWERLMTWFEGWSAPQWGMAGAAAIFLVAAVSWMKPAEDATAGRPMERSGMVPASYRQPDDLTVMPFIVGPAEEQPATSDKDGQKDKQDKAAPKVKPPFSTNPHIQGTDP